MVNLPIPTSASNPIQLTTAARAALLAPAAHLSAPAPAPALAAPCAPASDCCGEGKACKTPEKVADVSTRLTTDGNTAAAHAAFHMSDGAILFPITPATPMGEVFDAWQAAGKRNIFGVVPECRQMESEAGASGALHGAMWAGGLFSSFTSSQGLLLFPPPMMKCAGELQPVVVHIATRSLGTHSQCIYPSHDDVAATRSTGWCMIASSDVQTAGDLAVVTHAVAPQARLPFAHFFDGFRTSHELSKIELLTPEAMKSLMDMDAIRFQRSRANLPDNAQAVGLIGNAETSMQHTVALKQYYQKVPGLVQAKMDEFARLTGRQYHLFDYVGPEDAENVVVVMGSGAGAFIDATNKLSKEGQKVGVINVRLWRPFSPEHLFKAIPKTCKRICVMDRYDEPGCREQLYLDVVEACASDPAHRHVQCYAAQYGLGGKEINPTLASAVYANLASPEPRNYVTVMNAVDDVTHTNLPIPTEVINAVPEGTFQALMYGLGADGTVGASKTAMKIVGDATDNYIQGYFEYDAKKSGGVTRVHCRFGPNPIKSAYFVDTADYIGIHKAEYASMFDFAKDLAPGGAVVINAPWTAAEVEHKLTPATKRRLAEKKARLYLIDANRVAESVGLGGRISTIMLSAFFRLSNIHGLTYEQATTHLKADMQKMFGRKGDKVVKMNQDAIDAAANGIEEVPVPAAWAQCTDTPPQPDDRPEFIREFIQPIVDRTCDTLPVSKMLIGAGHPTMTSHYDKRGLATHIPVWDKAKCVQCNICTALCPHQVIRCFVATPAELSGAPEGTPAQTTPAKGKKLRGLSFTIKASPMDCTGCTLCTTMCPTSALSMTRLTEEVKAAETPIYDYLDTHVAVKEGILSKSSVRGSGMADQYLFNPGACPGCGESSSIAALLKVVGDRCVIANASGCSVVYLNSLGSSPLLLNARGRGPAYMNSLFEDNAEASMGQYTASSANRRRLLNLVETGLNDNTFPAALADMLTEWTKHFNGGDATIEPTNKILDWLDSPEGQAAVTASPAVRDISDYRLYFLQPSFWQIAGDGAALDIGFGGVDHVLASKVPCKLMVLDSEVYSNTGGQRSKGTPRSAVAKFAAGGQQTRKKDLPLQMLSYDHVYVATCANGADPQQMLTAVAEAEEYSRETGCPALVYCWTPCIAHGIEGGMGHSAEFQKLAVESGFFPLFRRHPKTPTKKATFTLDSKAEPDMAKIRKFLDSQVRFTSLKMTNPAQFEELEGEFVSDVVSKCKTYRTIAEQGLYLE